MYKDNDNILKMMIKINEKHSLENELEDLQNNKIKLSNELLELENMTEKLKKVGIGNFFSVMTGTKKINNARKEDIAKECTNIENEISLLQERIKIIKNDLDLIKIYDKQLDEIVKERIQEVKNMSLPQVQEILISEERMNNLIEEIKYNIESLDMVDSALDTIKDIIPRLLEIREYSMYDTVSDVPRVSIDKYTLLDKLQPSIEKLQGKLDMLKQRVNDCKYIENVNIEIDPVLRAKDMSYIFINSPDIEAHCEINASCNRIYLAEEKLENVRGKLLIIIEKVKKEKNIEREKIVNMMIEQSCQF